MGLFTGHAVGFMVGAAVLGSKLFRIYGPEFTQGGVVLLILIGARSLDVYGIQLLNILNAVNRPDVTTFCINHGFIGINLVWNRVLV